MTFADDSILVFLDTTPSGGLAKSAAELLGAAASVGTPVAVIVGDAALATDAAALGAASVLVAAPGDGLGATAVDALDGGCRRGAAGRHPGLALGGRP